MGYMLFEHNAIRVPMGPTAEIIAKELDLEIDNHREHNVKIAAIQGAITGAMQTLNPNGVATFNVRIEADETGMRLLLVINAAGIAR